MTKHLCDKCGKEFSDVLFRVTYYNMLGGSSTTQNILGEYCPTCIELCKEFMKAQAPIMSADDVNKDIDKMFQKEPAPAEVCAKACPCGTDCGLSCVKPSGHDGNCIDRFGNQVP